MIYEYREGSFLPQPIPDQSVVKFLDSDKQIRPILAFDLFLAGREAMYSNGRFHLLGEKLFQFDSSWLGQGIRLTIDE